MATYTSKSSNESFANSLRNDFGKDIPARKATISAYDEKVEKFKSQCKSEIAKLAEAVYKKIKIDFSNLASSGKAESKGDKRMLEVPIDWSSIYNWDRFMENGSFWTYLPPEISKIVGYHPNDELVSYEYDCDEWRVGFRFLIPEATCEKNKIRPFKTTNIYHIDEHYEFSGAFIKALRALAAKDGIKIFIRRDFSFSLSHEFLFWDFHHFFSVQYDFDENDCLDMNSIKCKTSSRIKIPQKQLLKRVQQNCIMKPLPYEKGCDLDTQNFYFKLYASIEF